ncbi:MAG: ABC transporter permease [Boseongicola sp.]|nr:ABC transporter permease [Boseongicola sp.]
MTRTVLLTLLSHWKRRPFQLLTLILGLALATALWSGVQAINTEARKSYDDAANVLGREPFLVSKTGALISNEAFAQLRRNGWLVSPVVDGWLPASDGRVRVLGIDPLTITPSNPAGAAVAEFEISDFLGREGLVLAAPATALRLGNLGMRVRSVEGVAAGMAIMDIEAAQALTNTDGISRLTVLSDQPLVQSALVEVAPDLILEEPDAAADLARLTDSFHLNLTAFGLLSFVVGLFIVNGAVGLAFEQRRSVFRTLRAIGVTTGNLVALLVAELVMFALIAGGLGIGMGYLVAASLLPDVAATLRGLYGATVEGTLTLTPSWWLSGLAIAILGTALAAATSLYQVARLTPLATAQPRAWAMASSRTMRLQLLIAGLALFVATSAGVLGSNLLSGFTLLGGLLIAAALTLPTALVILLKLGQSISSSGPLAQWFWADTRQQIPGLSLALMALLLALSANIGVSTMVGSFRLTFTGWLDQRLASEVYIGAEDEADVEALIAFVTPRVDAVLPIWHTDKDLLGAPGEIYGVVDHETYRENWPLIDAVPNVWDLIRQNEGVLINEQLARRESLKPGDQLPMPGGWNATITGIYSDYGNPLGQAILPLDTLTSRYLDVDRTDFGLRLNPAELPNLRQALTEEFGLPPENIVDQASLKSFSLQIFERTFAVSAALNVLTLSVAAVAILTSLLTLAAMRLPQLAPVWALGISRQTLGMIELARAVVLALLTFILAIPVGLLLAWVLLTVINVEAFGWQLPMTVFPLDWLWLLGLSLVAAGLAGLWPAGRLATRPPADLIKVFAHER